MRRRGIYPPLAFRPGRLYTVWHPFGKVSNMASFIPVTDYDPSHGWNSETPGGQQARWCCEKLEEGEVLVFDTIPFELAASDRQFLLTCTQSNLRLYKNISYRPGQNIVKGLSNSDDSAMQTLRDVMRRFSQAATSFTAQLLAPYAAQWTLDYASFRPEAEQTRKLSLHKRNDLLHIDAFPSRPTRGAPPRHARA